MNFVFLGTYFLRVLGVLEHLVMVSVHYRGVSHDCDVDWGSDTTDYC